MKMVFVLVGAAAGQTMSVCGLEFTEGRHEFHGSGEQIESLTRQLSYYSAVPAHEAEAAQAEYDAAVAAQGKQPQATPQPTAAPVKPDQTDAGGALTEQATKDLALGEAIGKLDPAVDSDWTSNNLPSLDALEKLIGKKPTREEVNAVADGYTRAKAKAARA